MTAVGATNVGSVKVGFDPNLVTNTRKWELDTFYQMVWEVGHVHLEETFPAIIYIFSLGQSKGEKR